MKIEDVKNKFRNELITKCKDVGYVKLTPNVDQWSVVIDDSLGYEEISVIMALLEDANKTPPVACDDA